MSLDQDVTFLQRVPLFQHFHADQIKLIVFSAERRTYAAGGLLYKKGDKAHQAIVIAEGHVEAYQSEGDSEKALGRYGPGTILGENAMIVAIERASSVRALDEVSTICITRDLFRRVLDEYPDIAKQLFAVWAQRLNATINDISALAPKFTNPDDGTNSSQ